MAQRVVVMSPLLNPALCLPPAAPRHIDAAFISQPIIAARITAVLPGTARFDVQGPGWAV